MLSKLAVKQHGGRMVFTYEELWNELKSWTASMEKSCIEMESFDSIFYESLISKMDDLESAVMRIDNNG